MQIFTRSLTVSLCVLSIGCSFVQHGSAPSPAANAAECVDQYRLHLVTVFSSAADAFERGDKPLDITSKMGDEQKAARLESFRPMLKRLDECNGDAAETAKVLRLFAAQLEAHR